MHTVSIDYLAQLYNVCSFDVQAQYVFLYDAILEGTTSGGTEIPVEGLRSRMKELELTNQEGETGYYVEFNVCLHIMYTVLEHYGEITQASYRVVLEDPCPANTCTLIHTPLWPYVLFRAHH